MASLDEQAVVAALRDHCLGASSPSQGLVEHGRLEESWVEEYRSLVALVKSIWGDKALWPREVVTAIHFASFYLDLRYQVWRRRSGACNERTEALLATVRSIGELFLMLGGIAPTGSTSSP